MEMEMEMDGMDGKWKSYGKFSKNLIPNKKWNFNALFLYILKSMLKFKNLKKFQKLFTIHTVPV